MQKFKETIRVSRKKPDGSPGFREFKKGRTPESYGLTPTEIELVKSQLVEGGEEPEMEVEAADGLHKIRGVIQDMVKLDPKQKRKALWTEEGLPRVRYIENELKDDITEDQRDEAWANFKEEV